MSKATLNIGVFADCLKLPLRDGIAKAAEIGAKSFQMYTTWGDVLPENFSQEQRKEFREFFEGLGMALSATCADFGHGFVDAEKNKELIPRLHAQVDLAADLGTKVITTHIGVVPAERNETWNTLRSALNEIGSYAEKKGIVLATETGPESGPVLGALLGSLDTAGVGVNFDPANLIMSGYDVLEAVGVLLPYIAHTHAKDGVRIDGQPKEVPLGEGSVPWKEYVAKLCAGGFKGAFTIERESGADPIGDTKIAIDFLKQF